jgi:hypothetical protein
MSRADAAEVMREVAYRLYAPAIATQHPGEGGTRLREVLAALRTIYRHRPPESFAQSLTVFASIDPALRPHRPGDARQVTPVQLSTESWESSTIQVLPNRKLLAWEGQPLDLEQLSKVAVVYVLSPAQEAFVVGSKRMNVPNPNGYPSAFASSGFFLLEDALTDYGEHFARRSTCLILRGVWYDHDRLLFKNKPERTMRQSLAQHLRWALRDHAEIREEQNVTETRPIDVKVTWSNSELLSLIEIKWLGKSVDRTGTGMGKAFSAPGRTDEGIRQLVEYLEGNHDEAPTKPCKGYLVVYDGRRRAVTNVPPGALSSQQAWHYRATDIEWPAEHLVRNDFAEPRRFFLEPRVPAPW